MKGTRRAVSVRVETSDQQQIGRALAGFAVVVASVRFSQELQWSRRTQGQ